MGIPEDLEVEGISCKQIVLYSPFHLDFHPWFSLLALILRVLYRLRTLSEQVPFDVATFSYAFPLFGAVLLQGGIQPIEEDEGLEQLALALDIIKYHSGECVYLSLPLFVHGWY